MGAGVAAHGAELAFEKDGDAAGTFTVIAEIIGDVNVSFGRESFRISTPHADTIDSHGVGPITRGEYTYEVNFLDGNATHDEGTGIQKRLLDGDKVGFRFRGVGGGASDDEVIFTGYITSFEQRNPGETGARTATFSVQPTGAFIIDGTSFGTVS